METVSRVFDLLNYNKSNYNNKDILASKVSGNWKTHSIDDFIAYADGISRGLLKLGIRR